MKDNDSWETENKCYESYDCSSLLPLESIHAMVEGRKTKQSSADYLNWGDHFLERKIIQRIEEHLKKSVVKIFEESREVTASIE